MPADPTPEDWRGRIDLRQQVIVTIDGETARDFDDALSLDRLAGGAGGSACTSPTSRTTSRRGADLDLEAYRRGTSVYYPDRAIPMLPEGLSNGLCSLRPRVPRLTLSAFLELDATGEVRGGPSPSR
jgi:ribonuclease R